MLTKTQPIPPMSSAPDGFSIERELPSRFGAFYKPLHDAFTARQQQIIVNRKAVLKASLEGKRPAYLGLSEAGSDWRNQVARGDIVLVCDVGGGTADFSLIAITEKDGNLEVERISVGEHILLGGDNMDLALAYTLQAQLEAAGKSLDSWQFLALIHGARKAKVSLFTESQLCLAFTTLHHHHCHRHHRRLSCVV